MKIYRLMADSTWFPTPANGPGDAPIAIGGDLRPERLLAAYSQGIFPWSDPGEGIHWWSPDPRMILLPEEVHMAKSMRPIFNQKKFSYTADIAFEQVLRSCQDIPRKGQWGTWISEELIDSYMELNEMGYAHSIEVWQDGELVGGLFGMAIGGVFCGDSMFSTVTNASKAGFIQLVRWLDSRGFRMVDCQVYNEHLASLGAREVPRSTFLKNLHALREMEGVPGKWTDVFHPD